jgi:aryl-alcohol dehydrogenase-like predicted oxidoreductase
VFRLYDSQYSLLRLYSTVHYQSFGAGGGGNFTNEELVGKALKLYGRDKFIVATKFGITMENGVRGVSGKESAIRAQLADSLARLDIDYIDLYYMHRMDPATPIEETMFVLKSLIDEGKIRYIGLSECTPEELRRAHAIHPITAIQMEWSLQTRDIETSIVPVARELGVGIVAYSPLGRGFLADIAAFDQLDAGDWRRSLPRFNGEAYEENKRRVAKFFALAERRHCTPAQLALAWVHSQGEDVFPIPGTKTMTRIEENANAFKLLPLSPEEKQEIEESVEAMLGDRYTEDGMKATYAARLDKV